MNEVRNTVHKHSWKFNRPATHKDRKKEEKKYGKTKHKGKGVLDGKED